MVNGIGKQKTWGYVNRRESDRKRMKWKHPKHRQVKKEVPTGQPCGESSPAFPGDLSSLSASEVSVTLMCAAWGTNRGNEKSVDSCRTMTVL